MPHYIAGGFAVTPKGSKHPSRSNIQVFDLLCVADGGLFIAEEDRRYEVAAGHFLILRPDRYHYATAGNQEMTSYFWLHFQTAGSWEASDRLLPPPISDEAADAEPRLAAAENFIPQTFTIQLPQFGPLIAPQKVYEIMQQLNALEKESHLQRVRWRQQLLFLDVLEQLDTGANAQELTSAAVCADRAAAYLRLHYKEEITAQSLGEALNFHPVYISRCMQKEFGCPPFEYLLRYRLEQAKLLLLQTSLPIVRIAEEVGFNQAAYFTSCFVKYIGVTPRAYRQRFSYRA